MENIISIKPFDDYASKVKRDDYIHTYTNLDDEEFRIAVKTFLSPEEIAAFVGRVVDSCFDKHTGRFVAAYKEVFFKITALQLLTDCPMPEKDGNIDIVKAMDYADAIGLNRSDSRHGCLIEKLERLVDQQIEYEKSARIAQMSATTEKAISRFMAVCDKLEAALGHFSAANSEKALAAIQSLADKGITPKGIIDAFMDNKFAAEAPAE